MIDKPQIDVVNEKTLHVFNVAKLATPLTPLPSSNSNYLTMKTIKQESLTEINTAKNIQNIQLKNVDDNLSRDSPEHPKIYNIFRSPDIYTQSLTKLSKLKNKLTPSKENYPTANGSLLDEGKYSLVGKNQCLIYENKLKKQKSNGLPGQRYKLSDSHLSFSKISVSNHKQKNSLINTTRDELYDLYNIGSKQEGKLNIKRLQKKKEQILSVDSLSRMLSLGLEPKPSVINQKHKKYQKLWDYSHLTNSENRSLNTNKRLKKLSHWVEQRKTHISSRVWPQILRSQRRFDQIYSKSSVQKIIDNQQTSLKLRGNKKLIRELKWIDDKEKNSNILLHPLEDLQIILGKFNKENSDKDRDIFEGSNEQFSRQKESIISETAKLL